MNARESVMLYVFLFAGIALGTVLLVAFIARVVAGLLGAL